MRTHVHTQQHTTTQHNTTKHNKTKQNTTQQHNTTQHKPILHLGNVWQMTNEYYDDHTRALVVCVDDHVCVCVCVGL